MSVNFENKKKVVDEIKSKIEASKSVIIVDYKGLTVLEATNLRNEFRKENCEYKVLKNTLVRKAFNDLGVTSFDADLNGTTAVAFGADETTAAKIVVAGAKSTQDKIQVKSGYVDGSYVDQAGVKALAAIPSKEALYGQLAGTLLNLIGGLAIALNKVAENKEQAGA